MHVPSPRNRFPLLDLIRGLAVLLMIIFHACYDLTYFGFMQANFQKDLFWWTFPRVIVFLFLFSVGMGLYLSHVPKLRWRSFWKRFLKIAGFASIISVSTYFMFPDRWIYFGTLHCIAITSLFALPFRNFPKTSLISGLALIIPSAILKWNLPWIELPHKSMDYIPVFPWLGVVLLGIFAGHKKLHTINFSIQRPFSGIEWLGIHSLWIYLIHQPILFFGAYLLSKLK